MSSLDFVYFYCSHISYACSVSLYRCQPSSLYFFNVYLQFIFVDTIYKCVHVYLLCRGHAGTHGSGLSLRELHVQVQSRHYAHITTCKPLFLDFKHNVLYLK